MAPSGPYNKSLAAELPSPGGLWHGGQKAGVEEHQLGTSEASGNVRTPGYDGEGPGDMGSDDDSLSGLGLKSGHVGQ